MRTAVKIAGTTLVARDIHVYIYIYIYIYTHTYVHVYNWYIHVHITIIIKAGTTGVAAKKICSSFCGSRGGWTFDIVIEALVIVANLGWTQLWSPSFLLPATVVALK